MSQYVIQLIFDVAMLVSGVLIGKNFFNTSSNELRDEIRENINREMKYMETIRKLENELIYERKWREDYEKSWLNK